MGIIGTEDNIGKPYYMDLIPVLNIIFIQALF